MTLFHINCYLRDYCCMIKVYCCMHIIKMHRAVLKSYQFNPSDFILQRASIITEGTDFSHLLTGDAAKKYGMSNNTSKTRMLGTGCYTQF